MKKQPIHPLFWGEKGYSDLGAYLDGLTKSALIDVVIDALECIYSEDVLMDKPLPSAREFIKPRLIARSDREPMSSVYKWRKYRTKWAQDSW